LASATVRQAAGHYDGVMIMAVRSPEGALLVPPRADTKLSAGDLLIVVGPVDSLSDLAERAR
jgi:K+/H+ antiporter YhaU regulatory subunit KhtT